MCNFSGFSDYDKDSTPSTDSSPGSSGPGSALPSPDSIGDFQNYKGDSSGSSGGSSNGSGILRNNGWYSGSRQCTLTPQTIELLRTLIIADEEEERKEREEKEREKDKGDKSPRRASRVSPLPPIEELSPEREEESFQQITSPEPQAILEEVMEHEHVSGEEVDNAEAELEVEGERVEKEDGESCYGSMASVDTRDSDRLEAIPSCEQEGTETSPSSDEMNLECRNTLYGNAKVAKSCQEVSHWLLNYTQEPMRKSYSLDVGMLPRTDNTVADTRAEMEVCEEVEVEQTSEEVSALMTSPNTAYSTFPSGWTNVEEDQLIHLEGKFFFN